MEESKEKCPICQSKNLEFVSSPVLMIKNYEKHINSNSVETGQFVYNTAKYLCLECGLVFEVMPKETLKDFNRNKKYFK